MAELEQQTEVVNFSTGVTGAEQQDGIMISKRAIEKINEVREQNNIGDEFRMRIGTQSGGCSGMSYALGFDDKVNENDKLFDEGGIKMVVDRKSLFYLMGVTLDFAETMHGSGFVFNNPNNQNTCGCGGH
ncbi:MAG: HesB/IscA family protein [Candidatus Kapaibacterium sp.]